MHLGEAEASFSLALVAKPNYLDGKTNHAISLLLQHRRAAAVAPVSGHFCKPIHAT
jgi:hypothetical protein